MPVVLILDSLSEVEDKILEHELESTTKFITQRVSNSKHLNIRIEGKPREMAKFFFHNKGGGRYNIMQFIILSTQL